MSAEPDVPSPDEPRGNGSFASSRRITGNALVRIVGEVVAKAVNVVLFLAIARVLGQGDFGDFIFGLSISGVLMGFAGLGTDELVAREVARDHRRLDQMLANVLALKASLALVFLGVLAAIVTIGGYEPSTRVAVLLIGVGVGLEVLTASFYAAFQALERMQFIAVVLIAQRLITTALAITALALGAKLIVVAAVMAIGGAAGLVLAFALLVWRIEARVGRVDRHRFSPLVRAGLPLGITVLLFALLIKLDASMLSFLIHDDNRSVGTYGAAYRLIEATMFISWSICGAVLPWLSRQRSEGGPVPLARGFEVGFRGLLAVLAPIAMLYLILAEPLIRGLYGAEFAEADDSLRLLAAMTVLYGLNTYAAVTLIARDRPGLFAKAAGFVVVQNVAFNFVLIPEYGAEGAAANAVISGCLLAVASLRSAGQVTASGRIGLSLVPAAAAAFAMFGSTVLLGSTVPGVLAGLVVFAGVLVALERMLFPEDFALYVDVLRHFRQRDADLPVTPSGGPGL